MKKFLLFSLFGIFCLNQAQSQSPCIDGFVDENWNCENVDMWAFMTLEEIGGGQNTNDVWGWTDPESRREFALIGKDSGLAIIEITVPDEPIYLGDLPTHTSNSLWRDVKVQGNFAYVVSEAGDHGLQVLDLTELLNVESPPITFEEYSYSDDFGHSHNVVINPETQYVYSVGGSPYSGGLHCLDVSDPANPVTVGGFSDDGYTHDAQVVYYHGTDETYAGKEIAFLANEDNVAIVDVSNKTDMNLISSFSYAEVGYTHQLWLTEDHQFMLFGDELDEMDFGVNTKTYIIDLANLEEPEVIGFYEADVESIDHNLYIEGNLVYESNYRSGLRILDAGAIGDAELTELAYFDVSPSNDNPQFSGSWSNYCFFPSGAVIVSDMYDGFFVLKPTIFTVSEDVLNIDCAVNEYEFDIAIATELSGSNFEVSLNGLPESVTIDATEVIAPGVTTITLGNLESLPGGIYNFEVVLTPEEYGEYIVEALLDSANDPGTSEPVSPMDETITDVDDTYTFEWTEVPGALSYEIEFSESADFDAVYYSEEVFDVVAEIEVSNLILGDLFWRVRSIGECGVGIPSTSAMVDFMSISINENELGISKIFPNPTSGMLRIELNFDMKSIQLFDVTGRKMNEFNLEGDLVLNIDMSSYENGTYIIADSNGLHLARIVKK